MNHSRYFDISFVTLIVILFRSYKLRIPHTTVGEVKC